MNPRRTHGIPFFVLGAFLLLGLVAGCSGSTAAPPTSASPAGPASSTVAGTGAQTTAATVALGTTPSDARTAPLEVAQVDLIMDWLPWVLDIPIDVAQAKGFYAREGLKVNQSVPADPTDVVKFVSTGRSQFGLYYAPDLLMAMEQAEWGGGVTGWKPTKERAYLRRAQAIAGGT